MVRAITTLTLLAAAFLAWPAAALPPLPAPAADAPAIAGTPALPALPAAPLPSRDGLPAVPPAGGLLCRQAVEVTLAWYGARITDSRDGAGEFLLSYAFKDVVRRQVPVHSTVRETVGGAAGSLFGLVEPVTREVTRITGYRTEATVQEFQVDLRVSASWKESYLDWGTYRDTIRLALLPGLPFLTEGKGHLVSECDPGAPVLGAVPDPSAEGVDVWCAGCTEQPEDGWAVRILGLDVRLAGADAQGLPRLDGDWILAPHDLERAARAKAAGLGITAADAARQAAEHGQDDPAGPSPAAASGLGTEVSSAITVPPATAAALALVAACLLGAVAVAGRALLRRK